MLFPCGGSDLPTRLTGKTRRLERIRDIAGRAENDRAMKNETVIDGITVGGQPSAEELRSGRFASVVNIRLESEAGNDTAALLAGSDVAYSAVPWTVDTVTSDDIARIRAAVEASEGPVLIH
jgi:protein tyrosine phosphatase (PTP) superfamily phosphohydrolase (DUF442 family)